MECPADTIPMYDLVQLRQEFPVLGGCIYLDSASTSPTPVRSVAAIMDYFSHSGVNYGRRGHRLARMAAEKYEETRDRLGGFLGVPPEQVVFTRNTTSAIDLVARGICWEPGDEVVTTALEHHANLIPWLALRDRGVKVRVVPQQDGFVLPADLQEAVGPATRLVAVNHVTNVLGTVQPVMEFARIAHDAGAAILLDAAQSAGHIPLPPAGGFDYLAVPGHKGLLGPQGTGALFLADPDSLAVACSGGGMGKEAIYDQVVIQPCPDRFSPGTPDLAAVIGLGPAIGLVEEFGLRAIGAHEKAMGDLLWDGLAAIPGVRVYSPPGSPIISFALDTMHPDEVALLLDRTAGICVSGGFHCALPLTRSLDPRGTVRASIGCYTSPGDVEALVEQVRVLAGRTGADKN
jgi:cysteine desulfurase/selenocysteine lyase